jgi:hypothetical protein
MTRELAGGLINDGYRTASTMHGLVSSSSLGMIETVDCLIAVRNSECFAA